MSLNYPIENNFNQKLDIFEVDTKLNVTAITCKHCNFRFVIYEPETQHDENRESRFVLVPLESTKFCPFCGKK